MIITLKQKATEQEIKKLTNHLEELKFQVNESKGESYSIIGVIGDTAKFDERNLKAYSCVENIVRITEPYKKVNRKMSPDNTIIKVGKLEIGGNKIQVIAGPCSVESKEQLEVISKEVKKAGASMFRGGAYKPRTSPYAYQGMGLEGLKLMNQIKEDTGMPIVSELMSADKLPEFEEYVDIIQIGARNMQNFQLLKALGGTQKPILLKRGFSNTIEEWLMAAEYIMASGNPNVIFCERGIRTFEKFTRNTLDISAIPAIKKLSHLPIVVDPSHAAGRWDLIEDLSKAAIAAGADGLIIEVHNNPEIAISDGAQSLKPNKFKTLMDSCKKVAKAVDREI